MENVSPAQLAPVAILENAGHPPQAYFRTTIQRYLASAQASAIFIWQNTKCAEAVSRVSMVV